MRSIGLSRVSNRGPRMTVIRMTSPVTPPSTSPGSNEAQAPQATSKPVHRLSFSVAALLADTRKPDSKPETPSVSPRSSPVSSYSPIRQAHLITSNSTLQRYPADYRARYLSVSPNVHDLRTTQYSSCESPRSAIDARLSTRFPDTELDRIDTLGQRSASRTLDYLVQTSTDSTPASDAVACSSPPKVPAVSQSEFGSQSPRSSSHEARSRCSETEDIEDEDENSLVDVEDLQHQQQSSSPTPVRPTPAYIGGFSSLGSISGIPTSLHPAVWGGSHQGAAATFFPSHFSHHAPLNGEYFGPKRRLTALFARFRRRRSYLPFAGATTTAFSPSLSRWLAANRRALFFVAGFFSWFASRPKLVRL